MENNVISNNTNNNFDPYAIGNCKYGIFQVHRLSARKYDFLCKGIFDTYTDCKSAAFAEFHKNIYKTDFYSLICVRLSKDIEKYTLTNIEFAKGKRFINFLLNMDIMGNDGKSSCGLSVEGSGSAEIVMTLGSFDSPWVAPRYTERENEKTPTVVSNSKFNQSFRLNEDITVFVNEVYSIDNNSGEVVITCPGVNVIYSARGYLYDIAEFLFELKFHNYFSTSVCDRVWHSVPRSRINLDNTAELREKANTLFADLLKNGYTSTKTMGKVGA